MQSRPVKDPKALDVTTLNVRFNSPNDPYRWDPVRRDITTALLRETLPDVLAVQEATKKQIDDIDGGLQHQYGWVGHGRLGVDDSISNEHTAIFYNKKRVRLIEWGCFWDSDHPGRVGSRNWGQGTPNSYPRPTTFAGLELRGTGLQFLLVNVHLEWPEDRLPSAKLVAKLMRTPPELVDQEPLNGTHNLWEIPAAFQCLPNIVVGDFNEDLTKKGAVYRVFVDPKAKRPLKDARESAVEKGDIGDTWHNWGRGPKEGVLDGAFHTTDLKCLWYHVDHYGWGENGKVKPSDHYPVNLRFGRPSAD